MAQLCHQKDDFTRLDTGVVLVSFGAEAVASVWLEEHCPSFQLALDPERTTYHAYGVGRSFLRSWNLRTLWRYVQLLRSGRRWRGIQGDSAQLGGDFIIDEAATIRLAYRSRDPTDRPSAESLLSVLRQIADGEESA